MKGAFTMDYIRHDDLIDLSHDIPLIAKYNTIDYLHRADNAFQAWLKNQDIKQLSMPADRFQFYCALGAVYQIGRIQGIREERQRRKKTV